MMEPSNHMDENWNLVGNAWAVDMLRQQVARGSMLHAYLFAGPRGVGRSELALRFAKAINCTQPIRPGVPCGTCWDCTQIANRKHPDLAIVEAVPKDGKRAADTLGNRRADITLEIDQVRDAQSLLMLMPYRAKRRVALFLHFEEASLQAQNAMLKTLEDTPPSSILILVANGAEQLLPTIVSRCEVVRLQPVPVDTVQQLLEQRGAPPEHARLLAHVSGGRPGTALRLMEDTEALAYRDEKLNELLALLSGTRVQRFAYAEKLSRDKTALRGVLMLWLSFWRDVLWRAGGASTPISNIDRQQEIEDLSRRLSLPHAARLVETLDQGLRRLELNINPRLLAEVLLLDWPR